MKFVRKVREILFPQDLEEILNPRKKQSKNEHKKIIKMILEKVFSGLKNLNYKCKCLPTTKRQNKTKNTGTKYKQV